MPHAALYDARPMNILVIGSGGREHALGWKLRQSPTCGRLYFAPGNGGTASLGENVSVGVDPVNAKTVDELDYFCRRNDIGLIVVGPEDPLAAGLTDLLAAARHRCASGKAIPTAIFGPGQAAARLEADKAFAKKIMRAASIPTAEARIFSDPESAMNYVRNHETPVVVKAAGLAKGKGVVVCDDQAQAVQAVNMIMSQRAFGQAGDTIVVEERLVGQELSVLALVDGRHIFMLDPVQDHKQVGEHDTGPNTGGMGAYCPTPLAEDPLIRRVQREIMVPIIDALRREGVIYQGVLYAGLMLTAGGPKVLEFNCRFGDPETQALMMRLQGDLVQMMLATVDGRLDEVDLSWDPRCCCCVVMSSGGYPGPYQTNKAIAGLEYADHVEGVQVFHAGTKIDRNRVVTSGGRVLNVCALGKDLAEAQKRANAVCEKIEFEGAYFRRDIGFRVMPTHHRSHD